MEAEPLTAACELAFAVAREDREAVPPIEPPAPMRSFLYVAQLPKRAISVAQRVIDEDPEFRARVAGRATEANVGTAGYAWLHRTTGWESYAGGSGDSNMPPPPPAPPTDTDLSSSSTDGIPPIPAPPAPTVDDNHSLTSPSVDPGPGQSADNSAAAIEDELTNLRSLVDRLADERKVVSSSVHELESEVEQRRSQSTDLQDELDMLRSDLDAARTTEANAVTRAAELERQLAELRASTERLDSERRAAQDRLEQTEVQLVDAQRTLVMTEQALQAAQTDLANAQQQLESSRQGLGSFENTLAEKDSALVAMNTVVAERDAALAERDATLSVRETALAAMDADLASKNAELALRSSELSEARERLASIEALVADRDAALAERAEALSAKDAALADVTDRVTTLEATIAERDAMVEARDAELASDRAALATKSDELAATTQRLESVESSLAETTAEYERVSSRLVAAEAVAAQLDVLREDLSEAQNEREDLRARLEVAEQARVDLEDQLSAVSSQWRDLQVELVQLGEQRATVEHELAQLLDERKQSMTERADLFNDLAARLDRVQAERDMLAAQLAATRRSLDGTRLAFEDATESIGSRLGDTEAAFVDLERANARLAESTAEASAIKDHRPSTDAEPDVSETVDEASVEPRSDDLAAEEPAADTVVESEFTEPDADTGVEDASEAADVIADDPFAVLHDGPGTVAVGADPSAWLPDGVTLTDSADVADSLDDAPATDSGKDEPVTGEPTDESVLAEPVLAEPVLGEPVSDEAPAVTAIDGAPDVEHDASAESSDADDDPFSSIDLEAALTTTGLGAEPDPTSLGLIDDIDAVEERSDQSVENDRCRIDIPESLLVDPLAVARHVVATDDVVLLVDGDAVAGMGWPSLSTSDRRTALVSYLGDLAADTGAAPDTIFDGAIGEDDALPVSRAVRVRLTAAGIEPASALSELVDSYPREWPVAVVTDNPILAADAQGRGAAVLNNGQLLDLFIAP